MSAFSKGLFFGLHSFKRPKLVNIFFKKNYPPRAFSTTSFLFLAAKKPNAPKVAKRALPKASPKIVPKVASKRPSTKPSVPSITYSYALTLAQKRHETLLYIAPSHTAFNIASYTTGIFCLSWAYYSINGTFLDPPEGVAFFVPWTFGVVSLGMIWFGTRMLLNTSKIIYSMTAIPKPNNQVQIEIVLRKILPVPGFPARKLYVSPQDMTIPAPMLKPSRVRLTERDYRYMRLEEKLEKEAAHTYEKTHIISRPFREIGRPFKAAAQAVIRSFNRDGFMEMRIKGKIYKLDATGGWALDNGKAIDRLVKLEPHVSKWLH